MTDSNPLHSLSYCLSINFNYIVSYLVFRYKFTLILSKRKKIFSGLLKFPVLDAKISNKFIQFECTISGQFCGGWGDRLKGILSTYAISMIIDREFTIKMTRDCDLRRILEPNEINWDHEQVPLKVKNGIFLVMML
ncbi:hypothetical protein BpHYR1_023949 [Brachionus plicatilis]|uniref:Uncharacterized protein n=1 Tax=Brachionus plicatilis TaxID=10195 RepID=A0A3M7SPV7_BRAPC|nr:hypothetical protein BpHYR1_023949 [Brachionus plicatilis]